MFYQSTYVEIHWSIPQEFEITLFLFLRRFLHFFEMFAKFLVFPFCFDQESARLRLINVHVQPQVKDLDGGALEMLVLRKILNH